MIRITIVLIFLIISLGCSKSKNCAEFRTGVFELIDNNIGLHNKIERYDNLQIETNLKTGDKTVGSIEWINNCEYIFTYKESTIESMKEFIGLKMTVEIYRIRGKTIYFKSAVEGYDGIVSYKMTKTD